MDHRDNLGRFLLHELHKARKGSSVLEQDKTGEDKRQYLRRVIPEGNLITSQVEIRKVSVL
jgi:hypothetical protein